MIREEIDPKSGAILFKKDEDSLELERVAKELEAMELKYKKLEDRVTELENKLSK